MMLEITPRTLNMLSKHLPLNYIPSTETLLKHNNMEKLEVKQWEEEISEKY
jgi:hypothetical protein